MPVHDWTRVEAGIFHALHTTWIGEIQNALNESLLPEGFYALAEQHIGSAVADTFTLHAPAESSEPMRVEMSSGGTAVIEAPPQVRRRQTVDPVAFARQRTLAIRHVSGHRIVAMLEIVSPANKDRPEHVKLFVQKAVNALDAGIHLLIVDLFPPRTSRSARNA